MDDRSANQFYHKTSSFFWYIILFHHSVKQRGDFVGPIDCGILDRQNVYSGNGNLEGAETVRAVILGDV